MSIRHQVEEFHIVGGAPVLKSPQVPSDDRVRLRARILAEEFFETLSALFSGDSSLDLSSAKEITNTVIDNGVVDVDLVEFADGLGDLDYVSEGARLEFGIDGQPIADEIHRSNMAKFGPDKKPRYREDGKILKPADWTPPDILSELKKQGMK